MPRAPRRTTIRAAAVTTTVLGLVVGAAGCSLTGKDGTSDSGSSRSASPSSSASSTPSTTSPSVSPSPSASPSSKLRPKAPLVVIVSVDGLNPQALVKLAGQVPSFERLRAEGVSTQNARTSVEETITLPNHTGILTGRPVDGAQGHGVTFNEDNGSTLEKVHGSYVPGVFDVVHDHGLRTGLYAGKSKFEFLVRSWDTKHGAVDRTGEDDGRDKLDREEIASTSRLMDDLIGSLTSREPPRLAFLHIADPDVAGHAHGWLSPQYLDAVKDTDRDLGRLLDAISDQLSLVRRTTVILTADHGGQGRDHSNAADPDDYVIPFYLWGRAARGSIGKDLYALNPRRKNPGTGRPSYSGAPPIRNLDAADLALRILRLPLLPGTGPNGGPVSVGTSR